VGETGVQKTGLAMVAFHEYEDSRKFRSDAHVGCRAVHWSINIELLYDALLFTCLVVGYPRRKNKNTPRPNLYTYYCSRKPATFTRNEEHPL
jgi:hypothetical protein